MIEKDVEKIKETIKLWNTTTDEEGKETFSADFDIKNLLLFLETIKPNEFYHTAFAKVNTYGFFKEVSLDTEKHRVCMDLISISSNYIDGFTIRKYTESVPSHIYIADSITPIDRTIFNGICKFNINSFFKILSLYKINWTTDISKIDQDALDKILNISEPVIENSTVEEIVTEEQTTEEKNVVEETTTVLENNSEKEESTDLTESFIEKSTDKYLESDKMKENDINITLDSEKEENILDNIINDDPIETTESNIVVEPVVKKKPLKTFLQNLKNLFKLF